ncbi:MAG: AraC family transcriptional regulator [Nibricoccus sp.]
MARELESLIERHCPGEQTQTAFPRLRLYRSHGPTALNAAISAPLFCVIASGCKRVFHGDTSFYYDAESYLISSAEIPVFGQVVEGPYLGLNLELDPATLAQLVLDAPSAAVRADVAAFAVTKFDDTLRECVLRLLRLLDEPHHLPVLGPLAERELLYRLLLGPRGPMLREFARPASQLSRIGRAITLLRERFAEPLPVKILAAEAGMSVPSFHRHFRGLTKLSPHQYQKCIRLHKARRRLLNEDADVANVGFDVGYQSPSQFSREYRQLFGEPPAKHAARLRDELQLA